MEGCGISFWASCNRSTSAGSATDSVTWSVAMTSAAPGTSCLLSLVAIWTGSGTSTAAKLSSIGVSGGVFLESFDLRASRFFSSVRKKTFIVVRSDLFGLQSSAATGECSQTGHVDCKLDWPVKGVSNFKALCSNLQALTSFTNRLVAARETEGIHSESAASGASKLNGNLILRQ